MKKLLNLLCICFFFLLNVSSAAYAVPRIQIQHGHSNPFPIALNFPDSDSNQSTSLGNKINSVIMNDLESSGMFRFISNAAFIENKKGIKHTPLFTTWRQINANLLVNSAIEKISDSNFRLSIIVWDTVLEKEMFSSSFDVPNHMWRRMGHKIADKIYEKITGDKGYFDTKIVYVAESGNPLRKTKRIAIMDQDGANHQFLTSGKDLVLTPRFSPKSDKILYLSYASRTPKVFMRNLLTGKEQLLGHFPGMSFAPRFSPDGYSAVMSIAKHGSTHLYEINLQNMKIKQLTYGPSINTSPSYSPDGKKIVFNSDRSGTGQLYVMDRDGSNIERISFGGGFYSAPSWSPRGDYIAFTKLTRGEGFTIGVMRPTGNHQDNGERIITSGYLVEGPCWAPNGRVILFTKELFEGSKKPTKSRVYSIDLTGYNEREVKTPQNASDPEWSRLLQ